MGDFFSRCNPIISPDKYQTTEVNWSTIVVWLGALVAGAEVAALQIRRTLAVSDATASIAIAIAWVVAIAIAWVVPIAIVDLVQLGATD